MNRRDFHRQAAAGLVATVTTLAWQRAWALSLGDLSTGDLNKALAATLEQGATSAVGLLGKPGGFLDNPKVRIPLPKPLEKAAKWLTLAGKGKQVDEAVTAMNRAAEAAVPMGQQALVNAVKTMSVDDARAIIGGGDNAVTQFFSTKTRASLTEAFLPVVAQTTDKVGAAKAYNKVAAKASQMGLIQDEQSSVQHYVTGKTLDGLYTMIGEEERKLRQDPAKAGTDLLKKVWGAVKG
ncbi:MAG: hypothetical protein RI907_3286 [Pseudomonadota bacterium]|jgi:hypothetical protein